MTAGLGTWRTHGYLLYLVALLPLSLFFNAVIKACEPLQHNKAPYKQITLVRLTYEYARSEASRDNFLRFFFQHTQIPIEISEWELIRSRDYGPQLIAFADTLVDNFFLPRKTFRILSTVDVY